MKTFVLVLCVGLLLGLTWGPSHGQAPEHAAVGAQEHEPSGQPQEIASGIPVDDLDRGTPRRAVEGFRRAVRAHHYQRAAEYLDLRHVPAEATKSLGPQLARQFKIVMEQQVPLDIDRLSDSPTGPRAAEARVQAWRQGASCICHAFPLRRSRRSTTHCHIQRTARLRA
jgi:hypothetical protein